MVSRKRELLAALLADAGDSVELQPVPGQVEIKAPEGCLPPERAGMKHGWHSNDAIQIPTSLTCNLCPSYHVKKKDRRHPLSCPEGRMNQICPVLVQQQQRWAFGLIEEIQKFTGQDPTPSDNARIEQIIRHRSKIFQIENYLKVAGLIDLVKGEVRNVADRLTTTENALSRVLTEFRQALSDRRGQAAQANPNLKQYLQRLELQDLDTPAITDGECEANTGDEDETTD